MNSNICTICLSDDINFDIFGRLLLNKSNNFYIIDDCNVNNGVLYSIISILKDNNKKYCIRSRNVDVISDCIPDVIRVSNNWDNTDGVVDSIIEFGMDHNIPVIFEIHAFSNNCLVGSTEWYSIYPNITYEVFIQEFSYEEINRALSIKDNIFINKNVYFRDIPDCFLEKYNVKKSIYLPDYLFSVRGLCKTYSITFANDFFKPINCKNCTNNKFCNGIRRESRDLSKHINPISTELNVNWEDLNKKLILET